jgi:Glycine zipper
MNVTPRFILGSLLSGILAVVMVGMTGLSRYASPLPAPAVTLQASLAASDLVPAIAYGTAKPAEYQPVTAWYKSKHWWKRNAPIVGGAAGGALVGGLVGGGTGALVGGAIGGGGGYLYKRHEEHHRHHYHNHEAHYHNEYRYNESHR